MGLFNHKKSGPEYWSPKGGYLQIKPQLVDVDEIAPGGPEQPIPSGAHIEVRRALSKVCLTMLVGDEPHSEDVRALEVAVIQYGNPRQETTQHF